MTLIIFNVINIDIYLSLIITFFILVLMFARNLKLLRKNKNQSQVAISRDLSMTRAKYTSLENGQVKTPSIDDLIKISQYYLITIDSLVKSNLSEIDLKKNEENSDERLEGKNLRILSVSVNENNEENIEYIPIEAKAGYNEGHKDPDYIALLPKIKLPNLPKGNTYRMFPTRGESMLPIPDGSDVIATYVDDWGTLKSETPCIVILRESQDFVFKKAKLVDNKYFTLSSFNPAFDPFNIDVSDVHEIWKYYSFHSKKIPSIPIIDEQIIQLLTSIKKEIKELKK